MSSRSNPLFDRAGRPTPFLMAQWRQKGAAQPLQARVGYLGLERAAEPHFRALWRSAFPNRQALPNEPLAERDGRGTDVFWERLG